MTTDGNMAACLDRISEVYHGGLWSERLVRIARERIQWMVDQTVGEHVLDVGCSQGIASILLARKGCRVVGIDIAEGAIRYAEQDAAKEPLEVRRRLQFIQCALEDFDPEARFDTVVLGEVLEHQDDPIRLVRDAVARLAGGGRLILTTPFGYNPHDDHKVTLFPSCLTDLSGLGLRFQTSDVVAGYIRALGIKVASAADAEAPPLHRLMRLTEVGALNAQRRLFAMVEQRDRIISSFQLQHSDGSTAVADVPTADSCRAIAAPTGPAKGGPEDFPGDDIARLPPDLIVRPQSRDDLAACVGTLLARMHKQDCALKSVQLQLAETTQSAAFRLGKELVKASRHLGRAAVFPYTAARIALQIRAERRKPRYRDGTRTAARIALLEQICSENPIGVLARKEPTWFEFTIEAGQIYKIGGATLCQQSKAKGALLLVKLCDAQGKQIKFDQPPFHYSAKQRCLFGYIRTGLAEHFHFTIAMPATAEVLQLGIATWEEKSPVFVTFDSVVRIATTDPVDSAGLSSGSTLTALDYQHEERRKDLPNLAVILDSFTTECLEPDVNLLRIGPSDWARQLDPDEIVAFFAESAWRGNDGAWKYAMSSPKRWGMELFRVLEHCRSVGLPTVFWSKEDPANFQVFAETAARFDYIFTTDAGCVPAYRERAGHDRVATLMFAAQSAIHNPIRGKDMLPRIAFTGSWRGVKYPKRAEWLRTLLMPVQDRGLLDIYDRFAAEKENPDLVFPPEFQPALHGSLDYRDLIDQVYKRYLAFVSVNSVDDSDTMLARRVFEILACGAPVISSPSRAIEKTFGDLVFMPETSREVEIIVDRLGNDAFYRDTIAAKGVRLVHSSHTYRQRLETVGEVIGRPLISRKRKKVSVICVSMRPQQLAHVAEQVLRQRHADFEFLFVKHGRAFDDDDVIRYLGKTPDLRILQNDVDNVLAHGLNAAMALADGEFCAKFDDDDYYGPNHLLDAVLAFDYAPGVGVVGKQAYFAYIEGSDRTVLRFPGQSYCYTDLVQGGSLVWDRRRTEGVAFPTVKAGTDTGFLRACRKRDIPVLSIDPFNFVHVRRRNLDTHTWKIDEAEFLERCKPVGSGLMLDRIFV